MTQRMRSATLLIVSATAAAALGVAAGVVTGVTAFAPDRASAPSAWALYDGFEDSAWPDPGLWTRPTDPDLTWRPSNCRAKHGERALRAFGGDRSDLESACNASVAPGTVSRITMTLDLRETTLASRLDLFFELWLLMPAGDDQGLFIYLLRPIQDGSVERIPIFGGTAMAGQWAYPRRLDLMNLENIENPDQPIDLRGGRWSLEWVAYAPRGAPEGGGVFVDDVSMVWEPDPAVPIPTTRPRPTATATLQPTDEPTPTPRPTVMATATPEPDLRLFLPLLNYAAPATPTPEPSETPATTDTVEPGRTPGATGTSGTPGASGTPAATGTTLATGTPEATESASATAPVTPTATSAPTSLTPSVTPGPMDWHIHLPVLQLAMAARGEALADMRTAR